MFELVTETVSPDLAGLGDQVELRELSYGALRAVMRATTPELAGDGLLGACLFVDGAPIGLEALLALPGRFSGAIGAAMAQAMALHGLVPQAPPLEGDANDQDDRDAPADPQDGEPRQGEP